jgi:hypothetical protein
MRKVALLLALSAVACGRKEHSLPLEPEPAHAAKPGAHQPHIAPHVYERFTLADFVSAANSRYGTVELNLTTKPDVALAAAEEARTYLLLAKKESEQSGHAAMVGYQERAANLLVEAAQAAKAGDNAKATSTLLEARRALDAAIELVNGTLMPASSAVADGGAHAEPKH